MKLNSRIFIILQSRVFSSVLCFSSTPCYFPISSKTGFSQLVVNGVTTVDLLKLTREWPFRV